jgi:hypothetical protein
VPATETSTLILDIRQFGPYTKFLPERLYSLQVERWKSVLSHFEIGFSNKSGTILLVSNAKFFMIQGDILFEFQTSASLIRNNFAKEVLN